MIAMPRQLNVILLVNAVLSLCFYNIMHGSPNLFPQCVRIYLVIANRCYNFKSNKSKVTLL